MTQLNVYAAAGRDTSVVLADLASQFMNDVARARMVFAFYGCEHDDRLIHDFLGTHFLHSAVLGGTSAGGIMTHRGVMDANSIGLLLIDDADGSYGVAAAPLDGDPAQIAETALHEALANCNCAGELPELIWVYQTPGHEEKVMEGLRRVVGDRCPIIGGSSADNDVSGKWRQLGPQGPMANGLSIGVLFPSSPIGYAFQGGYEPAGPSGIVTGTGFEPLGAVGLATGAASREIISIDGEPAAAVYDRWIGNRLGDKLKNGGTILAETTLFPIATDVGQIDGVTNYLLIHPESVTLNGTLKTFCEVEPGARVYAMKGNRERLVSRAGRVAREAQKSLPDGRAGIAGALLIYCGGCKLAVGEDISKVATAVSDELGAAPFLGCFTYGEQGRLAGRNVHGNLMISAIAFSR
jgi:hypothetical protein